MLVGFVDATGFPRVFTQVTFAIVGADVFLPRHALPTSVLLLLNSIPDI